MDFFERTESLATELMQAEGISYESGEIIDSAWLAIPRSAVEQPSCHDGLNMSFSLQLQPRAWKGSGNQMTGSVKDGRDCNNTKSTSSLVESKNRVEPTSSAHVSLMNTKAGSYTIPQFDGSNENRHEITSAFFQELPETQRERSRTPRTQCQVTATAVMDLLPFCTSQTQLDNELLIRLSDVAGSLKEIVLLALGGAIDSCMRSTLERAVGPDVSAGIIEFWSDEWVADM
ncbi:uncharacterized protein BDR25DRAFT_316369 [Lindgomyces ingoldianus]|uniref:Uncharacterized protein n=1 Tax=Lindgomyces ingoldianus TaxID=673940 RepID=A0ACB6QML0_9PLEO|nr:uncharacterized protein BDR25DRAFT_316369 [Lindgomyces ingoldianus]KAF2468254.1 hypothetical protein BDR25DRAFT_316369 [Lindgomyces ingoldianus]